jgi:hypothetical protein
MNRGCAGTPLWQVEFNAFNFSPGADTSKEPNEKALIDLLNGLKLLVAKGPSEPFRLTPQQQREVHARLKMGEPRPGLRTPVASTSPRSES